jgi:hypothetical protein
MENYPQQVKEYVKLLSSHLTDLYDEDLGQAEFEHRASEKIMQKFLNGEDFLLEESEMEEIVHYAAVDSVLNSLKKKNLVDSVEDESGEDIFFLTKQGKMMKDLYSNENQNK